MAKAKKAPPKYEDLVQVYPALYRAMTITGSKAEVNRAVGRILTGRQRYEGAAARNGKVPWYLIGVIHEMERSCDFRTHLHNGDPLTKPTVNEPAGRPPGRGPFTWDQSVDDALRIKGLHLITDWPLARVLFEMERYNGFGYRMYHAVLSPYLWSMSSHYTRGKYTSDGTFSPSAVSKQVGGAVLLKALDEKGALRG